MIGLVYFAAFAATVPLANFLIGNVGTVCVPMGPCLIPVAPGLLAPSGVLVIGAALVLRDLVHETMGARSALLAILVGAALSLGFASPGLAVASVAAFVLAEVADLIVYSKIRARSFGLAILASGLVGAFVDSAAFLLLAFGSLDYLAGQVVGKVWATALAFGALSLRRDSV
jgi:uncharacterized PurR-regulated membrane protein YhhQ (DUF165 family)